MNNMRNRGFLKSVLCLLMLFVVCGCEKDSVQPSIQIDEMRSICELATQKCYFNNVAAKNEKSVEGFWIWAKDLNVWVEYTGTVECVIDVNDLVIKEELNDKLYIKIPAPIIKDPKVDKLTEDSYYVDDSSVDPGMFVEFDVLSEAQKHMVKKASEDKALLEGAQNRAKLLLEEYIKNIKGEEYVKENVEFELAPIEIPQDDKKD